MGWIRVDDRYKDHPKHAEAGPLGQALWLAGLAYCNANLTDGFIPWSTARSLLSWEFLAPPDGTGRRPVYTIGSGSGMSGEDVNSEFVIRLLLHAGLWEQRDGGYYVHDYPDYQPLKRDVLALRELKSSAGRKGGLASAQAHAQAHAQAESKQSTKQKSTPNPNPKRTNIRTFRQAEPDGFAAFWSHYPRHTHRKAAVQAWVKLSPGAELQAAMIHAIAHQKRTLTAWQEFERIPHPATWINGRRWEDEIPNNGSGTVSSDLFAKLAAVSKEST